MPKTIVLEIVEFSVFPLDHNFPLNVQLSDILTPTMIAFMLP